ncbi:MAG: hypothetical protein PHD72_04315 [Patescibacteria group bacterium]|nr:hypothetical protein [Patescibacteria group bacterium]
MKKTAVLIFILAVLLAPTRTAALMTSSNYTIYADAVDSGGGLSAGGSYILQDTVGESPAGFSTSSAYEIRAGYQHMEKGFLTLQLSATSLNLGTLSASAVNVASTTATISTDASAGFSFSTTAVAGTVITAVADGTVSAGSEEYGFTVSGNESQFSNDVAVASSVLLAASTGPVTNSLTVLNFKASMASSTTAGSYSQTVTVSASANL